MAIFSCCLLRDVKKERKLQLLNKGKARFWKLKIKLTCIMKLSEDHYAFSYGRSLTCLLVLTLCLFTEVNKFCHTVFKQYGRIWRSKSQLPLWTLFHLLISNLVYNVVTYYSVTLLALHSNLSKNNDIKPKCKPLKIKLFHL